MKMRMRWYGLVTGVIGTLGMFIVSEYNEQPYRSILYVGSAILIGFALKCIEEGFEIQVPCYQQLGFGDSRYAFSYAGMVTRERWNSIFGNWAYVFVALWPTCQLLFWIISLIKG